MSGNNKDKNAGMKELERAKLDAELAKKKLTSTMGTLQDRLKPANLASEAWSGVRDKGGEIADNTMQSVKDRPEVAGGILAVIILFFARHPLMALISHLFSGEDSRDLVTTKVSKKDDNYDLAAPAVSRSVDEGVIA